jgi:hypothetical protein
MQQVCPADGCGRFRILDFDKVVLLLAFFAWSCAAPLPSEPTDFRSEIGRESASNMMPAGVAGLDLEIETLGETINVAATPKTFTLKGVLTDKAHSAWKISAATVAAGSASGKSSSSGSYTLRLRAGTYTIKITKNGYATATIRKKISANMVLNAPLTPIKPAGATARCNDRTWSFSQNRSGTCSRHRGVAYWVCPGKLCH